ncbi:retrovirus-related pol polyprotein from transposon TNT 1-94 [Tanacetum coccineum]
MLLTSLPPSYDNFVETLLYERESLTLEDVLSSLNSRELKKRTDAKDDGDGLYVRGRSDHQGNQGRGSSRSKSKEGRRGEGQGSGMHFEGYDNGDLLMAVSEERFLEWIMDSGGSFHMTPRREFLFDFNEFNGGTVLHGDNRACAIMGIGKVRVQIKDGSSFMLENVRYIPELKINLISLGTLDREGYTVKLQNGRVKVIKGSLMVLSGTMKGNYVYSLDGWPESGEASVGIQEKGKYFAGEFGLEVSNNRGSYRLCHADYLWGAFSVESMSGCRYFLSIVDDYPRRVWVHFLRHKNEAFSKFKEWKQLVENQNGLAERMNRTLLNKVMCLLIQSGLLNSFWAEATDIWRITEAEYMALTKAVKESIWLKGLLIELGVNLREIMESKDIGVAKIGTKDNAADAFTKVVPDPALLSSGLIMSKGKEYTNPSSLAKRQEPSPIHASEKETITAPFTHANPPKKIKEYAS